MALFKYRDFSLKNEASAMKITTDSLLLGEWMSLPHHSGISELSDTFQILDIGTGTGIISLIAASRIFSDTLEQSFSITGIDIDAASAAEAASNFKASRWSNSLKAINISLENYIISATGKFDAIVSNPPFFSNSLVSPDGRKATARHTTGFSPDILINAAFSLLKPIGRLTVIYPLNEGNRFVIEATAAGLFLCRECFVKNESSSKPIRLMAEFSLQPPAGRIISQTMSV